MWLSDRLPILAAVPTPTLIAWMGVYQELIFHPCLEANSPVFWFMMQIGMIAGVATMYPMNWLLIKTRIKEKM